MCYIEEKHETKSSIRKASLPTQSGSNSKSNNGGLRMNLIEDYDMCQACKDAVAVDRARGYRVCRDCYYEMGV